MIGRQVCIVLLLLAGCGGAARPQDAIIGTWQMDSLTVDGTTTPASGFPSTIEQQFQKDGTTILTTGFSRPGKYIFTDDTHTQTTDLLGQVTVEEVHISGNQLTLTTSSSKEVLTRTK